MIYKKILMEVVFMQTKDYHYFGVIIVKNYTKNKSRNKK